MKKLQFIVLLSMILVSCVTQKKCFEKFPPQIIIKDSTVIHDSIIYHDTTITIPGDTITDYVIINCDSLGIFSAKKVNKKQGRTTLLVTPDARGLFITCKADSLQLVIDSLKSTISRIEKYRTETKVIAGPTVIKYKWPPWLYWLLAGLLIYLIIQIRGSIIKIFTT